MIRTTKEELGEAYLRASRHIMAQEPMTPRIMGALWREQFGLHHRYKEHWFGDDEYWIEFPNEKDYTLFLLRWA